MILAITVLALILILAIRGLNNPFVAVMAFVVAYECQPGELYPALASLHLERVLLIFVLLVFWRKRKTFQYPPITKKFLWFYGSMLLSSVFAFWRSNAIQFDMQFLEIVLYHLLLVTVLDSEERTRKYLLLYTGLVAWIGASALYEYHIGVRIFTMNIDRAVGITSAGGDPDTMATTMAVSMPLALLLMGKGTSKWIKLYGIALFTIYLATIIDTGSRTAFLAFVFFLFMAVFSKRRNWKYVPVVLAALPLLWIVIPQQYKTRYETVETRDQDKSYTDRLLSWQGGVHMFLHNPITGIGPDDYSAANGMKYWPEKPRIDLNAHSLYFKLLGELGLLGIFTFFAYLFSVIGANRQLARRLSMQVQVMDPLLRQYPAACNLCLYLLLFTGYSAHNTYRSTWYTMGAVTAAIALLKPVAETSSASAVIKPARLPAWVPAKKAPAQATIPVES